MENRESFNFVKMKPPHDKSEWVKIIVKIKSNITGEIVDYHTDGIYENGLRTWIWEEGNFACDCNRELFYLRTKNIESIDSTCDNKRYSIKILSEKTKEIIYSEY